MLLDVDALSLRIGGVAVLSDVTFSVADGERLALLGPNGAGKTSVLNCVCGLHPGHGGRIRLGGEDLGTVPSNGRARLGVARTFQHLGVVPDLDVGANLLLGRHHRMRGGWVGTALRLPAVRREEEEEGRACRAWAERLGLAAELSTPARMLGAGALKRLELGRALAAAPRLLLLDEPFAGASVEEAELMAAAIRETPAAVVLVDHNVDLVMSVAAGAVTLEAGRPVTTATAAAV